MAFEKVVSFDCDSAIQLGGKDKKTGKSNPKQVEGYYLGSKQIASKYSKTGFGKLHIFQTAEGNLGVYGKTNLDQQLSGVNPGTMTRATHTGMVSIPGRNPMYKYEVAVDRDNTIDLGSLSANSESLDDSSSDEGLEDETDPADEGESLDEVVPERPRTPIRTATTPDAARQAQVRKALLGRNTG